jgi:type IX secretion system PorP/SprF family membrane protein
MNRAIAIIITLLVALSISAQQMPRMGGYNIDPFHLTPAAAGLGSPGYLFLDHRSDFSGIPGGPKTYMLSWHNKLVNRMAAGGRFIYDKTDIFTRMMVMGTYAYEIPLNQEHTLNLALSAGLWNNSVNLGKYYDDPDYVDDPALTSNTQRSKVKFASDFAALYRYRALEAGVYFSGLMFGDAVYENEELTYNPSFNYMMHAAWLFNLDSRWSLKPYMLVTGTENSPLQVELMAHAGYTERLWGNLMLRTGGVWGAGLGGEVYNGIVINYAYNFSHRMPFNTFSGHIITVGVNLGMLKRQE